MYYINLCLYFRRSNEEIVGSEDGGIGQQGGPAVLYLPLGGNPSSGCPTLAESSVTGISQMVFLWTGISMKMYTIYKIEKTQLFIF